MFGLGYSYDNLTVIKEVIDIEYSSGKFKLRINHPDDRDDIKLLNCEIKMEDENDFMNVAEYACCALEYFSQYKKLEHIYLSADKKLKFNYIIEQTRKIILRFIKLHPTAWRLLDIRYDLMNDLIEAKDYGLINDILSSKEVIHVPHSPDTIRNALSDNTILALFLDYYSNNAYALQNIGWMNTVVDIIPELQSDIKEKEYYTFYIQKLFYNPCFGSTQLDILHFEFIEISPNSDDLLKVFIPITQLIPQDSKLKLQEINYDKIADIRTVPFTDFTTNKKILTDIRERKFINFLKSLIFPSQYSSLEAEDHSPFIQLITKIIKKDEHNLREVLYENPSMGAIMNWMWRSSKFYWPRALCIFALYFLTYSIISWAYIAHFQITDLISIILPVFISSYILVHYYTFENGFKNAETRQNFTFIIFLSILILWYELGHALFILLGYSYLESDNPFSNIIDAILAVYDWSSISFNAWNFWPLTIISVLGGFVFVIILQNIIISFMSDAFADAVANSKHGAYRFQLDFIYDFALLKKSLEFNDLDSKFKDKIRAKYICFYDAPSITKLWKETSDKVVSKPYPRMQLIPKSGYESWPEKDCEFIWKKEEIENEKEKEKEENVFDLFA
ncbi:transient receptor potential channel pyrexia-like [Gigaspora margarita]|uniref:Transient receptor potential channel pyrexia-like n=1 Tax=Gigaspora margarita TaxID=4874 RepID=A0A8H4EI13_GIGMA|nr:transient receptor potential channel pyrexia-like [Gigaspora margarita]